MERLGTCPICMGLCAAWLALGLLLFGLGSSLELFALAAAGIAGAAIFGILLILHAIFYLRRRKTMAPSPRRDFHLQPNLSRLIPASRNCCGRRS